MAPTDARTLTFPPGFLWGTATSAHQIEGGNTNNDWWAWEHNPDSGCVEPSGDACDSFNRWPDDVDLVAELGLGAYRFSLEWSRIEPADGEFSIAALDHYRRMCARCHERGVEPVVTLHHFTLPRWFADAGGWEAEGAAERFARYAERVGGHLGDLIGRACTLNEPNVVAVLGYTVGLYPPGLKDELGRHLAVSDVLVQAHRLSTEVLRSSRGSFPVGLALSMEEMVAGEGGEQIRDAAEQIMENTFLDGTEGDDFIGVQCYERNVFGPTGPLPPEPGTRLTQMGYEFRPQVVEYTVRRAASYTGLPVVVTENGIATEDDAERIEFVSSSLESAHRCLEDGVDVRGFFYWSLLDNFEWHVGFRPKFGLCAVDRDTFDRHPKPSARWFGDVARRNEVTLSS